MLSQKKEKVKELKDMNTEAEKLVSHWRQDRWRLVVQVSDFT